FLATIGVVALIITNLLFIPVVLSFSGITKRAPSHAERKQQGSHVLSYWLPGLTNRKVASSVLTVLALITVAAFIYGKNSQLGRVEAGASEFRAGSEYNLDVAYMQKNYGVSSDMRGGSVTPPAGALGKFETLFEMHRLER